MTITPQTLTLAGEDYVVIPRDEYERLRAAADADAADVAAIHRALETRAPAELVRNIVEGEHSVRVWRPHRGMTVRSLAVAAGIPNSYLSAIERGVKPRWERRSRVPPPLSTCRWTISCDRPAPPPGPPVLLQRDTDRPCLRLSSKPSCRSPPTSRGSPSDGSTAS